MKLRYELSLDDAVASVMHHFETSPAAIRQRLILRWALSLSIFLIVAVALRTTVGVVCGGVAAAIHFARMPTQQRRSCERTARRLYSEGGGRGLIGLRELELTEHALVERWDGGESRVNYEHVHKIESTPDYLLIYPNAVSVHTVPRRSVSPLELSVFGDALHAAIARTKISKIGPDGSADAAPVNVERVQ